jgi:hypothetical protein
LTTPEVPGTLLHFFLRDPDKQGNLPNVELTCSRNYLAKWHVVPPKKAKSQHTWTEVRIPEVFKFCSFASMLSSAVLQAELLEFFLRE